MIIRTWRGLARQERADAYVDYFRETGLAEYRATPGNLGVTMLRRAVAQGIEFLIVSRWSSMEAVRTFAGEEPERARFYPDDEAYFVSVEEHADHFEVVLDEGGGAIATER
jgi:heme-degrading monooxygenase HmoA